MTSCTFGYIFKVKNTTLGTTRVILACTAEIMNVLVTVYRIYRAIRCFSDIFGRCMRPIRVPRLRNSTMGIQHRLYFPCIPIVYYYQISATLSLMTAICWQNWGSENIKRIGMAQWACTIGRLDIAFAVLSSLSRFFSAPRTNNLGMALFGYLKKDDPMQ